MVRPSTTTATAACTVSPGANRSLGRSTDARSGCRYHCVVVSEHVRRPCVGGERHHISRPGCPHAYATPPDKGLTSCSPDSEEPAASQRRCTQRASELRLPERVPVPPACEAGPSTTGPHPPYRRSWSATAVCSSPVRPSALVRGSGSPSPLPDDADVRCRREADTRLGAQSGFKQRVDIDLEQLPRSPVSSGESGGSHVLGATGLGARRRRAEDCGILTVAGCRPDQPGARGALTAAEAAVQRGDRRGTVPRPADGQELREQGPAEAGFWQSKRTVPVCGITGRSGSASAYALD